MFDIEKFKAEQTLGIYGEYKTGLVNLIDKLYKQYTELSVTQIEDLGYSKDISTSLRMKLHSHLHDTIFHRRGRGSDLIAIERERQQDHYQWSSEWDDKLHKDGELAQLAACYAMPENIRNQYQSLDAKTGKWWPRWYPQKWSLDSWKPSPDDRIKELVKAGALIAAEIDRLIRLQSKSESNETKA